MRTENEQQIETTKMKERKNNNNTKSHTFSTHSKYGSTIVLFNHGCELYIHTYIYAHHTMRFTIAQANSFIKIRGNNRMTEKDEQKKI